MNYQNCFLMTTLSSDDDEEEEEEEHYRSRPPPPIPTSRPSSAPSTRKDSNPSSKLSRLTIGNDTHIRSPLGSAKGKSNRNADGDYRSTGGDESAMPDSPGDDNSKTPDATARYQKAR